MLLDQGQIVEFDKWVPPISHQQQGLIGRLLGPPFSSMILQQNSMLYAKLQEKMNFKCWRKLLAYNICNSTVSIYHSSEDQSCCNVILVTRLVRWDRQRTPMMLVFSSTTTTLVTYVSGKIWLNVMSPATRLSWIRHTETLSTYLIESDKTGHLGPVSTIDANYL